MTGVYEASFYVGLAILCETVESGQAHSLTCNRSDRVLISEINKIINYLFNYSFMNLLSFLTNLIF